MIFNINEKAKITTKNGTILTVFKYLGSYISSTEKDGRPMHGEHSTTSRIFGTLPCLMTSKEQSSWPRWNPSCYDSEAWTLTAVQEAQLDCCYTSMPRIVFNITWREGSGMRSSMEISFESPQKSRREDFEWQDTLNWLQATSFYGNRRRDELHEVASL